jgi:NitT/TauT family transport system permease protein
LSKLIKHCKVFLQGFLSINLIWYIAYLTTDTTVIPNPLIVYRDFGNVLTNHMAIHILYSLRRIGIGLAFSLIIGVPSAYLWHIQRK